MATPQRILNYTGRYSLVDGIPFQMPVKCVNSPVLMAIFTIDADQAAKLLPGNEIHPFRLWNRGLLVITVVDYLETNIGKYIEFSIAIACTHGAKPAPRLLPALFQNHYGLGQYVFDLPVSTEISVKGGQGIWGMPKHQASLNYIIGPDKVSSQYDLDGQFGMKIEIDRPKSAWLSLSTPAANYSAFRGMLFKSKIYFQGKMGFSLLKKSAASLTIGSLPRLQPLKELDINPEPFATAFIPQATGILDDYTQSWFLTLPTPPTQPPAGLECVVNLGLGEQWLTPPVPLSNSTTQLEAKPPQPKSSQMQNSTVGITFQETMSGGLALGETDPNNGQQTGQHTGQIMALHATITLQDVNRFIADPDHLGQLAGTLDYTPFGTGLPATTGVFNLFSPTDQPSLRLMVYEMGFTHAGQNYYLAGKKEVRTDSLLKLWTETTTLFSRLHQGTDKTGPVVGAGILTLGPLDLMKMVSTMHPLNAATPAEGAGAVMAFGRFFLGELWDIYVKKI